VSRACGPANRLTFDLGWHAGYRAGYAAGVADVEAAWQSIVTGWAEDWRRPNYAELQARREVTHEPCERSCGQCSRCIHSRAWHARGGRSYSGNEAS
jgi:hypothetical protein